MLASLPSGTTLMANLAVYSSPLFDQLLPFVYFAGGLIVGAGLAWFIIAALRHALHM